jgi:histidinol-phosphatase (PHP family)
MLYEMHMHTPLCKHARGEPEEYAKVAQQRGLEGIVVTCHNPTNDGWSPEVRMSVAEFDDYVVLIERARQTWAGRMDVRLGIESDYVPGMEPWLETLHGRAKFNHVLGSVHPHLIDYQKRFYTGDFEAFKETYFEHLAMAAETGLFDTIAHPDLVKNVDPAGWDLARDMDIICRCLDRIAASGTAMELNTSGLHKVIAEMNPGIEMLREMRQRNIPVVIGADAHDPHRVAANFEDALDILSAVGYTHTSIFLQRQRRDISIEQARNGLLKS